MEGIVKRDDGRSSCRPASDLYGIFDSFRTTIEEERFLRKIAGRQLYDTFGQVDIRFVHHHTEACMCKFGGLLRDGSSHFWSRMPNIHGANTAREIDIAIAVDIFDNGTISPSRQYTCVGSNSACHKFLSTGQQFT